MSQQAAYDALHPTFSTIPKEEFKKRPTSPAKIIADGNAQLVVAKQDIEELTSEGMDAELITDVEQALFAYSWGFINKQDKSDIQFKISKNVL